MKMTYTQKREYTSYAQRSVSMSPNAMVCSSQQLAALAGYQILSRGGNAVDAAVAMMSMLNVVEPQSVGIGGDAFALIYLAHENKLFGLNGSGRAPHRATIEAMRRKGFDTMPERGIVTATVPGALHAWAEAQQRFGRLDLAAVLEGAIHYAENGYPVSEVISGEWKNAAGILRANPGGAAYLPGGDAPSPGQVFRNQDLARTFRMIAKEGVGAFYGGEVCKKIVAFSDAHGGLLSIKDFQDHTTTWVDPISTDYRGYSVSELPPNGQGLTALEMLNIMEGYDVRAMGHNSPEYLHLLVEAKKMAFSDRDYHITDPEFSGVPVDFLASKEYAARCREGISMEKAMDPPPPASVPGSETGYVTAVDEERNAVSFISSIYLHFGSGVVVDGTGIVLQNRGKSFSLDPNHPNRLVPHKRPMHTIIPAMVFKNGEFLMSFGVMGGDMQPQGHVQFLANLIDFDMNVQEAVDASRVRHMQGREVYLEAGIPVETAAVLEAKGHTILMSDTAINQVGGGQAIYLNRLQNVLLGGSDRRKDGCALGY